MDEHRLRRTFWHIMALSLPLPSSVLCACSSADHATGSTRHTANDQTARDAASAPDAAADAAIDATVITSCGERIVLTYGPYGTARCHADCFPLEDGATVPTAEAGMSNGAACTGVCGPGFWFSCAPIEDAGVPGVLCQPDCSGRRPEGLTLLDPSSLDPSLGGYLAEMAWLEAASVHAFQQLRDELRAHRAPRKLVRAAERAAKDEVRHARMCRALAGRYSGSPSHPRVAPRAIRPLEAIALENAAEGCVRETFGALVATFQADTARDPVIRAAMKHIARDETRHAALAWQVDRWVQRRLTPKARVRVVETRRRASCDLVAAVAEPSKDMERLLGLPTGAHLRKLAVHFARTFAGVREPTSEANAEERGRHGLSASTNRSRSIVSVRGDDESVGCAGVTKPLRG